MSSRTRSVSSVRQEGAASELQRNEKTDNEEFMMKTGSTQRHPTTSSLEGKDHLVNSFGNADLTHFSPDQSVVPPSPLEQLTFTVWEAVEFTQVAHDTVTSGWWELVYPPVSPTTAEASSITNFKGGGQLAVSSHLQSSSDLAETLPASFVQHRQLITIIGEVVVLKLQEMAVVLRQDESGEPGLAVVGEALSSLVAASLDALAHIAEMATLPLHESKGSNAVAAGVCAEAAKSALNIVSELTFLRGEKSQNEHSGAYRLSHVRRLSSVIKRTIGLLSVVSTEAQESLNSAQNDSSNEGILVETALRFKRISSAIREVDSSTSYSSHAPTSSTRSPVRLGSVVIDLCSQVLRHLESLISTT